MNTNPGDIVNQAKQLIDSKRAASAVELLLRAKQTESLSTEGVYFLGIAYFRTKAFAQAEATFREVIAQVPDNHLALYYLGLTLERQDQNDAALRAFQTSVKLEPGFADGHRKLASLGVAGSAPAPPAAAPAAPPKTAPAPQANHAPTSKPKSKPMTEFMIPDSDEELDEYIARKDRKARAEYAQEWRATPLPAKIIQLVFLAIVLGGIGAAWVFLAMQALD